MNDTLFNKYFPFNEPRKGQRAVIERIESAYNSGKKHVILSAPTGVGKSAIALTIARYFKTAYLLTTQKSLQDQYSKDFMLPVLKGVINYPCVEYPNTNCKYCHQPKGNRHPYCVYTHAVKVAYESPITIFNYALFLTMMRSPNQVPRELLIFDECHNIEDYLLDFYSLEISGKGLEKYELKIPEPSCSIEEKIDWLMNVHAKLSMELDRLLDILELTPADKSVIEEIDFLNSIVSKALLMSDLFDNNELVIYHASNEYIKYKPLYSRRFFKSLRDFGNKTLSMSATIFSKKVYCDMTGLDPNEVEFISVDSTFPVENRLVHYYPIGKLNYANKDTLYPVLLDQVTKILTHHKNNKGIIHTVNYEIAEYLYNNLGSSRLILPRGATRDNQITEFMLSDQAKVLISPSLTEGIDLKGDLSRFAIICKLPYGNLGDHWITRRKNENSEWYQIKVLEKLIQMTGRSVRSESDYASAYVLDSSFDYFLKCNSNLIPNWWKSSIRY